MKKQKIIRIIILILGLILLLNQKVLANSSTELFKKVEYTDEFKNWLELSEEQKKNTIMPRMYKVKNTNIVSKNPLHLARMLKASINSRYSLKDIIPANIVIKDQKQTNTCWTFAVLSSLETNLAISDYKKGINTPKVYDFSERHMEYATSGVFANNVINDMGYNRRVGSGGNYIYAESYLTNGSGAILEKDMPFENNENIIDISQIQNKKIASQIYDTIFFPDYRQETGAQRTQIMNQVKQHIQDYGSVYAPLHGSLIDSGFNSCYNNNTGAQYCNSSSTHTQDHAVSIIGWDDNYSISNFPEEARPSANGAWIVKNSWGERIEMELAALKGKWFEVYEQYCKSQGWDSAEKIPNSYLEQNGYIIEGDKAYLKYGDNGIIYVSYEDVNISTSMFGIIKATDTIDYDNIYQYNEFSSTLQLTLENSSAMLCNVFDKKSTGTEYLTQVALEAPGTYICKVYVNPNGTGKTKRDLQLVELKSGTSETISAGYHTLEFAKPIKINSSSFAVVIEITNPEGGLVIPIENKVENPEGLWDYVTIENGKCFVAIGNDLGNCQWYDMSKLTSQGISPADGDSTIKAFTTTELCDESLQSIEIITPPTKTTYYEGENFDKTGMVIQANYNSKTNSSVILDNSSYNITNGTNLKEGQTSVTITYQDKSVNQTIKVEKNSLVEIKIKTPPTKISYYEREDFSKTGMIVEAIYKDGTTKTIKDYTIEDGSNLKVGQTSITIKYGSKSVKQTIRVEENDVSEIKEKTITGISINKKPVKTKYIQNKEELDLAGGTLKVNYDDNSSEEIDLTSGQVKVIGFNNKEVGKNTITITFGTKTTTFDVEIIKEEGIKNSNFDKSKCGISNVKFYTFTNEDTKEYLTLDVIVNEVTRTTINDSYEYYYYISSNQDERSIQNWVKITEKQTENDKIKFAINTKDINNCAELIDSNSLYLYIKEVAKKGGDQLVLVSKAMEMSINEKVEIYLDNAKVNNSNSGNDYNPGNNTNQENNEKPNTTNQSGDTTIAQDKLPYTGIRNLLILALVIIIVAGIIIYNRYKDISNYVK